MWASLLPKSVNVNDMQYKNETVVLNDNLVIPTTTEFRALITRILSSKRNIETFDLRWGELHDSKVVVAMVFGLVEKTFHRPHFVNFQG